MSGKLDEKHALPMVGAMLRALGLVLLVRLTYPIISRSERYRAWIDKKGWASVAKFRAASAAAIRPDAK